MPDILRTRFAPSPTGRMHLGNVRTALFNYLLARSAGGRFVLRIEDTDAERSDDAHLHAIQQDLSWLGVDWDEGPDVDPDADPGPGKDGKAERESYLQSQRGVIYRELLARLQEGGFVYPCWRTASELKAFRAERIAAGRPPVYDRAWGRLDDDEIRARGEAGQRPALRFRVPDEGAVEFEDLVRGPQRFGLEEIGDFVVRRSDGSSAFFFGNAVDDGLMGVTHVLRGDDHLSNTPRQILILEALGMEVPRYGHLPLLLATDGSPLSKRRGSVSLRDLREAGYMPEAVLNYIARLGHAFETGESMDLTGLAAHFDVSRIGRAPAHFDEEQLRHWQAHAVHHCPSQDLRAWAGDAALSQVPGASLAEFLALAQPNILFPEQLAEWAALIFAPEFELPESVSIQLQAVDPRFFAACLRVSGDGGDLRAMAAAVREATGAKGKDFFMPLRLALTGREHGPELGPLLKVMPRPIVTARLNRWSDDESGS
ncbi:MAG: glutamate--tRNA ligase [Gammaproteobacteria bacterium]